MLCHMSCFGISLETCWWAVKTVLDYSKALKLEQFVINVKVSGLQVFSGHGGTEGHVIFLLSFPAAKPCALHEQREHFLSREGCEAIWFMQYGYFPYLPVPLLATSHTAVILAVALKVNGNGGQRSNKINFKSGLRAHFKLKFEPCPSWITEHVHTKCSS